MEIARTGHRRYNGVAVPGQITQEIINTFFLEQLLNEETRENGTLDIVLTSNTDIVNNISNQDTYVSDHRIIILDINMGCISVELKNNTRKTEMDIHNFFHSSVP